MTLQVLSQPVTHHNLQVLGVDQQPRQSAPAWLRDTGERCAFLQPTTSATPAIAATSALLYFSIAQTVSESVGQFWDKEGPPGSHSRHCPIQQGSIGTFHTQLCNSFTLPTTVSLQPHFCCLLIKGMTLSGLAEARRKGCWGEDAPTYTAGKPGVAQQVAPAGLGLWELQAALHRTIYIHTIHRGEKPLGAWALLWESFVDPNLGVPQGHAWAGTEKGVKRGRGSAAAGQNV